MAKPLILPIGAQNLVIDPDTITLKTVKELARVINDVNSQYNPLVKHPMQIGETMEEWEKRVKEELKQANVRKADETEEEFVKRIMSPGDDNQTLVFQHLQAIAALFNQKEKVSENSYDQIPYIKARTFINELLTMCDLA